MRNKFLIVDDDVTMRELLCIFFEHDGEVLTAVNGLEALVLTKTHRFDIILSDINMPVMDGIEFCERAMENNRQFSMRLIMLTGSPSEKTQIFCRQNNISLLSKPVSMALLRKTVDRLLAGKSNRSCFEVPSKSHAISIGREK